MERGKLLSQSTSNHHATNVKVKNGWNWMNGVLGCGRDLARILQVSLT
jgi:hypothetical protein